MCFTHAPVGTGSKPSSRAAASLPTSVHRKTPDPRDLALENDGSFSSKSITPPLLGDKGNESSSRAPASKPTSVPTPGPTAKSTPAVKPAALPAPSPAAKAVVPQQPPAKKEPPAKVTPPPPVQAKSAPPVSSKSHTPCKPPSTPAPEAPQKTSWLNSLPWSRKPAAEVPAAPQQASAQVLANERELAFKTDLMKAIADGKIAHDKVAGSDKKTKQATNAKVVRDVALVLAQKDEYQNKLGDISEIAIASGEYRANMCHKIRMILDSLKIELKVRPDFFKS